MKNIHILPTDKPSRLIHYLKDNSWDLFNSAMPKIDNVICQNIYITNDEEIKEGDWFLNTLNNTIDKCDDIISQKNVNLSSWLKKIILTDNKDLIKDGVQSIPDEFLEWFVKNPSCEEVEVIKTFEDYTIVGGKSDEIYYKIIIPKEEPKTFKELFANTGIEPTTDEKGNIQYNFKATMKEEPKQEILYDDDFGYYPKELITGKPKQETLEEPCVQCCGTGEIQKSTNRKQSNFECDICSGKGYWNKVIEPKQETLEEAMESYLDSPLPHSYKRAVEFGAKWQQKRSYSEEEVYEILAQFVNDAPTVTKKWFNNLKKK